MVKNLRSSGENEPVYLSLERILGTGRIVSRGEHIRFLPWGRFCFLISRGAG